MSNKKNTEENVMKESGKITPFVGREKELRSLHQALNTVIETKKPKFVLIEGDFGVGKTTLVDHFLEQVARENPSVLISKGDCDNPRIGFMPFLKFLKDLAKQRSLQETFQTDWMELVLRKFAPTWLDFLSGARTQAIEGGDYNPQVLLFVQFTNALSELAKQRPMIAFFDNLDRADVSSLDLLAHLAGNLQDQPILFICTYLPEAKEKEINPNAKEFHECYVKILHLENTEDEKNTPEN
jgi:predicted ATPase